MDAYMMILSVATGITVSTAILTLLFGDFGD